MKNQNLLNNAGIYKLEFIDSSYYIGQTTNLNNRKLQHYRDLLKGNHFNYKVQTKYNNEKILPKFIIIKTCNNIDELNTLEQDNINIKDNKCLNILVGGINSYGYNAPKAKYLTLDIELVFLLLVNNPGISHKEVADFSGVDISTVHDISAGRNRSYTEMFKMYPEEYTKLLSIKAANTRGKRTVILKNMNTNKTITLLSGQYSQFCKDNNLQVSNLSKVINEHRKNTGGWELVRTYENF